MTRINFHASLAALFIAAASVSPADVVHHVNGQKFEGIILSETDDRVTIRVAAGEIALPRSMVTKIERDDPLNNAVIRIDASFRNNNVIGGLKALLDAYDLGADSAALNAILVKNRAPVLRGLEALRESDRIEARHQLRRLEKLEGGTPEREMLLAGAYLELDLPLEASDALQRAGFDWLNEDEEKREWAADFLRELVRKLALQARYHDAIEQVERLRLLDEELAGTQLPVIYLAEAAQQREAGNYEAALKLIDEHLWPTVPEIARDRSLVTLRKMIAWAGQTGNEKQARIWINRYLTAHLPVESLSAGRELYSIEASRYIRNDQPGMALRLLEQVPEDERTDELKRLWADATFYSRKQELGESDPPGLFELAQWAAEHELYDEAILALEELRKNEVLRELADQQITLLKRERDIYLLAKAMELYEKGLMEQVIDTCAAILKNPDRETGVGAEAEELIALAKDEIVVETNNRPYVAEAYYQQAERAFFTEDTDTAWELIDLILTHYDKTPAADRAMALLPDVMRQLELQLIEGRRLSVPDFDSAVTNSELRRSEQLDREIQSLLATLQSG